MSFSPYVFDEFFSSGLEESVSPFLTQKSRLWSKALSLKRSLTAAFFLILSFILSFYVPALSDFFLLFVYFFAGTPALLATWDDLKNLEINIDVLMTLAAFLSFLIGSQLEGGLLLVLFALSGAMEDHVCKKASGSLMRLNRLSPTTAYVLEGNEMVEKALRDIPIGASVLVQAGETVPLDGKVIAGSSLVNLSHLTGESAPISKKEGDEIQAGSRNLDGSLTIQVTRTSAQSTLSRLINLIERAQAAKPRLQYLLDRFGKYYAMTIIILFFVFATTLPLFFSISFLGIEGSIYRALTFLIAASPCALIIATPTAYLSAINACARKGIVLKGGMALDALASCQTIAFDKTGTLTTGKLTCESIHPLNETTWSTKEALGIAASLERHATHPLAQAICLMANQSQALSFPVDDFHSFPGYGLQGMIKHANKKLPVFIGNQAFIEQKFKYSFDLKENQEKTVTFLLIEKSLFAFYFTDTLRNKIVETVRQLKKNKRIVMLTGDRQGNADQMGRAVGIDAVYANLRPEDKLRLICDLSAKAPLAMVGDGLNDAPSLARASVGICLGKIGSKTAIDAADIVFLQDDLSLLSWLEKKARQTTRIVRENLSLALGVIVLASLPALLGYLPLYLAVLLHEGGTVLVGLNSLRLLKTS